MIAAGPGASAGLVVRLAGDFAVGRDGRDVPVSEIGSRKARQLLKYLAVERANKISVDRIAAVLWPEAPPQQPAENVATLVSRLRAALGPDVIDGDRTGYRLAGPPDVAVDLSTAGVHVAEARRRAAGGQPALALAAAQAALEIVGGGTALADEPYADWAEPARAELARVRTAARYAGAQAAVDLGDHATATALAAAATEADPYDEQAARLLMRAETAAGQPGRALAAYERLRALLADEFGVDPAPQTRDVHTAILREQPATAVAGDAPAAPVTPTRSPADPTDLVGRRDEVDALAAAWAAATAGRPALVLVTGEAGIGKTRLAAEVTRLAAGTGGTVLADGPMDLDNIPRIRDVETMLALLVDLGASAEWTGPNLVRI
jgi:DNA-binding SARP family transcriptional activator